MIRAGVDDPSALDPTVLGSNSTAAEADPVRRIKGRELAGTSGESAAAATQPEMDEENPLDLEAALDEAIQEALEQVAEEADQDDDEIDEEASEVGEDDDDDLDVDEDDELDEDDEEESGDKVEAGIEDHGGDEVKSSVQADEPSEGPTASDSKDPDVEPLPVEASGESSESDAETDAEPVEEAAPALTVAQLEKAVESVLFATAEPMTVRQLSELFEASVHDVREAVENLRAALEDSGRSFRLQEVAGGLQLLTRPEYHPWISRLLKKRREQRLSGPAMETLAVIAYKQPISKADLEDVRGVGCSPTLKTLMDRGLIKIVGREETLGRPLLYGTTDLFLESFGLGSIKSLPQPEIDQRDP